MASAATWLRTRTRLGRGLGGRGSAPRYEEDCNKKVPLARNELPSLSRANAELEQLRSTMLQKERAMAGLRLHAPFVDGDVACPWKCALCHSAAARIAAVVCLVLLTSGARPPPLIAETFGTHPACSRWACSQSRSAWPTRPRMVIDKFQWAAMWRCAGRS